MNTTSLAIAGAIAMSACAGVPDETAAITAALGRRPAPHCGEGEARASLQALETGGIHFDAWEGAIGNGGLGAWYPCQFRLWAEVSPVTDEPWVFCEHDFFLGGSASLIPYQVWNFCDRTFADCSDDADCPTGEVCVDSHPEAAAVLDRFVEYAQFGPVAGPLIEQVMLRTPAKTSRSPEDGNIVWYQNGYIVPPRAPGLYRSDFQSWFDDDLFTLSVPVEVVTHAEHEARVVAGTWTR